MKIPIEISARHLHLSSHDLEILFGQDYKMLVLKKISQPGQFAAQETVKLVGYKGILENVRIVAPLREETQIEISITDCFKLGVDPKILLSGNLEGSAGGVKIIGPYGEINLNRGVIVAIRHLHISPKQANEMGLKHLDYISIKTEGIRSVVFNNVIVRSREGIDELALHLDTDEANSAGIKSGDLGTILKP